MSKKGGYFFEEHIEKIVLAIVGLVCLWLLITHVLISPNYIEYDNKKFSPGDIDNYISKQAEVLEDRLNRKPEPKTPYKPNIDKFIAKINLAISDIDISLSLPQPNRSLTDVGDDRVYSIPLIGKVSDVAVEHIRAVAYVPIGEIGEESIYGQAEHEPNDIDFVTVEAKFDVAELYNRFYASFAGENLQDEWRDPCLAAPIFAAVQLQRQELLSDSGWSDWQIIPRTKIDHRKKMFKVIEELEELPPGGIKVRLLQFNDPIVTKDLLQPDAYMIASAREEWFPPSLHKEYVEQQREIDAQEKRIAKAAERKEREREREGERSDRRSRTPKTRGTAGATPPGMSGGPFGGGSSGGGPFGGGGPSGRGGMPVRKTQPRRSRSERKIEKERPERSKEISKTTKNIYGEFDKILLTEKTDITKMEEPLVFWAHDDTVEPRKSYRYRMRLGVFNPIAGTDQFIEQDKSLKNKVILWSEFSDATGTVDIPGTLYFFPREIQEAAKTVTVTACRYVLGYWYCKDFMVKVGETIGNVVGLEPLESQEQLTVPEQIDYTTGAVLIDVAQVDDWSGGTNPYKRQYYNMLYSFDGKDIERLPIKTRYWAKALQSKFNEIKRSEKEPKEPLRSWEGRVGERRRVPLPGGEGGPLDYMPYGY